MAVVPLALRAFRLGRCWKMVLVDVGVTVTWQVDVAVASRWWSRK